MSIKLKGKDVEKIVKVFKKVYWSKHKTLKETAKKLRISSDSLRQILIKKGLKIRNRQGKPTTPKAPRPPEKK